MADMNQICVMGRDIRMVYNEEIFDKEWTMMKSWIRIVQI